MSDPRRIEVGRLGAAHGVRGWLRVQSFTDPPRRLFEWKRWYLQSGADVKLVEARPQGNSWIARLEGIEERDAASRLSGQLLLVDRRRHFGLGDLHHGTLAAHFDDLCLRDDGLLHRERQRFGLAGVDDHARLLVVLVAHHHGAHG